MSLSIIFISPLSVALYKLLNMFRATLCPSSGADDLVVFFTCGVVPWLCRQSDPVGWLCVHWEVRSYSVELPHWSHCSWFDVCWNFGVVGLEWYSCCRLKPE